MPCSFVVQTRKTSVKVSLTFMFEFRRGHTRLVAEILAHFEGSDGGPSEESGLVYRLLHMETSKGYTPLHLAAARSDQSTAALLLDWGANPLIKCKAGKTALDISPDDGEEASALRSVLKAAQGFFSRLLLGVSCCVIVVAGQRAISSSFTDTFRPPPVRVLRRQFPAQRVPAKWEETTRITMTQSFS